MCKPSLGNRLNEGMAINPDEIKRFPAEGFFFVCSYEEFTSSTYQKPVSKYEHIDTNKQF